ncbi:MAG: hypothetical protein ACFNOP_04465 [Bacteroides sp.]
MQTQFGRKPMALSGQHASNIYLAKLVVSLGVHRRMKCVNRRI